MEPFTISTRLTKSDFVKVALKRLYRQAYSWIVSLISIGILVYCIVTVRSMNWSDEGSYMCWAFGLVFLQLPGLHYFKAKRTFVENPRINQPVNYTFDGDFIRVEGLDFEGYLAWNDVRKLEDLSRWICLVTKDHNVLIFQSGSFTEEQTQYIRSKV